MYLCLCGCGKLVKKENCYFVGHCNKGRIAWNKGLTRKNDIRVEKYSESGRESKKGKIPWNKGLTKEVDERLAKMSKNLSNSTKGISKNTKVWCKGLTKETDFRLLKSGKNVSLSLKKLHDSGKIKVWNKGLTKETDIRIKKIVDKLNGKSYNSIEYREKSRQRLLNGQSLKMIKLIKKISNEEIKLRNMVKELDKSCEFQHPVFNYALDIALVDKKIAIEYDGYYHFNCKESIDYHMMRQKKIEGEGWKFLRYTIFDKFPTLDQIKEDINNLLERGEV